MSLVRLSTKIPGQKHTSDVYAGWWVRKKKGKPKDIRLGITNGWRIRDLYSQVDDEVSLSLPEFLFMVKSEIRQNPKFRKKIRDFLRRFSR